MGRENSADERNWLLGCLGEVVVERMLSSLGFKVVPYGLESTAGLLKENVKRGGQPSEAKLIRSSPDFLVTSKSGKVTRLLEVKTTTGNKFSLNTFQRNSLQNWGSPMVAVVGLGPKHRGVWIIDDVAAAPVAGSKLIEFNFQSLECWRPIHKDEFMGCTISKMHVDKFIDGAVAMAGDIIGIRAKPACSEVAGKSLAIGSLKESGANASSTDSRSPSRKGILSRLFAS
ncbi:hypothetical protein [Microvirga pudoricolor]|uniref:hypothetical protein n=1 Tax=Microvirga pudoricolor TaxID=2778729 RepID=UPI00194E71CB|nr:hypothetical protein [Microvirga pudoricolor]MBM6596582.1 hypothetical protein [Microvirga pudoricolor]